MALHTDLPIYKHAYGLLRLSIDCKKDMRRDFKNSLGSRIHDECIEVLSLIADANQLPNADKAPVIAAMLRRVGKIEFLLRVCTDAHLISTAQWSAAIELLQAIGSQGGGWLKFAKKAPVA
jgi:hypothetical protein